MIENAENNFISQCVSGNGRDLLCSYPSQTLSLSVCASGQRVRSLVLFTFIIFLFFGIIVFMLIPYSGIPAFFFSANIDVTRFSSHNFNWGSACQRRCVLAVESTFQLASLSVNVYHLYSLCVCLCMTVCVLNV